MSLVWRSGTRLRASDRCIAGSEPLLSPWLIASRPSRPRELDALNQRHCASRQVSFAREDDVFALQLRRTGLQTSGESRRLIVDERITRRRFVTAPRDKYPQRQVVPLRALEKRRFVHQDVLVEGGTRHQIGRKPSRIAKQGAQCQHAAKRVAPNGLASTIDSEVA